jgi:hypothetical protein
MMDFFEEAEACSDAARRMACTLLGAEVDRWQRSERDLDRSFLEAGRIHLRVQRILDLAAPHFGRVSPRQEGGVAYVLAHLLEGAVPQAWSAERQSFARCVVEYMGARG